MQQVSPTFSGSMNRAYRTIINGVLVSWDKQTASGINYFTVGTSTIGGNDILKSTGGGTIAVANQYKYSRIPSSGIVSWSTSMTLDQYPYGLVQRQADITLSNASTAYLAASGTVLGPYIDSGRPVIIQAGFDSETIPMFTGYSDSPVNDINARTISLHCYDAIDFLNSYNSKATLPQQNQRADQIIATLLAEAGFSSNQYVLERSLNSPIAYLDPVGKMIGDIIRQLCEAEAAIFFADESGILHFWNRQHFSQNATPVATLSYSNIETLQQQNSPILNYVQASSNPLALVSGLKQVYSLDQPYYIQANGLAAANNITNPSLESNTTDWSGTFSRTSNKAYSGSYSLSGTNMVIDISASTVSGTNGVTATAQAALWVASGNSASLTLSGTGAITGTQSVTIAGNNSWQTKSLNATGFAVGYGSSTLNAWTTNANNRPSSSSFPSVISMSGYVYVLGDWSGSTDVSYATITQGTIGSFALTSPMPEELAGWDHGAVALNGYVYAIGGATGTKDVAFAKQNSDGTLGKWSQTSPTLTARVYASFVAYNGYIYMLGGDDQGTGNTLATVEYAKQNSDGALGTWQTTTSMPASRDQFTVCAYNGYIYSLGGNSGTNTQNTYYALINSDGTIGTWQSTTNTGFSNLPAANSAIINGYMYITWFGNGTNNYVYSAKINSDGTLGTWATNTSYGQQRQYTSLFSNNNYLFLTNGQDYPGYVRDLSIKVSAIPLNGVSLVANSSKPFYLDAITTDINDGYFDGNTNSNSIYTYAWAGTANNSTSARTPIPNYLTVKCALNSETYSLVQPTASGLNANNIGAQQSFYSFSSISGTGGIYGTDLTNNIGLVNYSVSGTYAYLTFQNNSSQQAYLTNLVLYGQVAEPPIIGISQFYINQDSINKYRLNPSNNGQIMTIQNDYIPKTGDALGVCEFLVQGFSMPYLKHTTTNFVRPNLQFGDAVNLYNRDTGETRLGYIVGINNSMDQNANFTQGLIIQEKNIANYFTIGTSTIGGVSQIAP